MKATLYRFRFRTGEVIIDHEKCAKCSNYACVKADSLFGTSLLRIHNCRPVLRSSDAMRLCNECLACELYCSSYGNGGLKINLDMLGLDEYRQRSMAGRT
jgi:hypothetical protein